MNEDIQTLSRLNSFQISFADDIERYYQKHKQIISDYSRFSSLYNTDLDKYLLSQNMDRILKSSTEMKAKCIEAQTAYKASTDKEFERTSKYYNDIKNLPTSGITLDGRIAMEASLFRAFNFDIGPIRLDIQRSQRDIQLYCQ